ncbi:Fanconi anemia group A protein homolog [Haliotis rufescens]|uniref:Fanconi anemia group A protein homolog n=1 Tax=Haliotis rufescens TaxID=6454 RepID=UPI00201F2FE5|nr:Fanconi anemia group A protein homolog [Haliotis rufescens]
MTSYHSKRKRLPEEDSSRSKRSFKDLIRSRNHGDRCLSGDSREVLHQAVFQLVSLNQDTLAVISEALGRPHGTVSAEARQGGEDNVVLPAVLKSLGQLDRPADQSVPLLMSEKCVQRLLRCTGQGGDSKGDPSRTVQDKNDNLPTCVQTIHQLLRDDRLQHRHLTSLLIKEDVLPPELLWCLHCEDIMGLATYVSSKMTEPQFVKKFSSNLYELCEHKNSENTKSDPKRRQAAISGILSFLINSGFPEKKDKEVVFRKVSAAVLDDVIRGLVDRDGEEQQLVAFVGLTYIEDSLNQVSFKKFCTHSLSLLMSHRPSLKVSQAFKQQTQWKSAKVSEKISDLYKQLFLPFESREIMEVLQRILERQEVNWQTVLSFIATFLVCFPDAPKLLQGHIHSLLSDGLENADMESTIIAFLLARQSCLEGLHVFPHYQDWFQQTFGDANRSPASSKKSFSFFMKFLTNIVPYESAPHLKVHILRPPHVPPKCRPFLAEYITLAKTRLTDLKESCEISGGIYDNSIGITTTTSSSKEVDPVEADIERSLTAFQATGKVPTTVMEASIFRKPYFVGRYLRSLLKPRHLPDRPDIRMKMIASLRKADKIPASMYTKYQEACRTESRQLLEGVFDADSQDDVMQDAMLAPLEQLRFRLQQLHNAVVSTEVQNKPTGQRVSEVISVISDKLEALLKTGGNMRTNEAPAGVTINPDKPDIAPLHLQIVDCLLNAICGTVTADLGSRCPVMTWLPELVKMASQHSTLHAPVIQRVALLLLKGGSTLNHQHMTGLSALVCHLSSLQHLFGPVTAHNCHQQGDNSGRLVDVLVHHFPMRTGDQLLSTLQFCTNYLEYSFLGFKKSDTKSSEEESTAVIPNELVKMFCLLCWRLLPSTRTMVTSDSQHASAYTVFSSDKYQQLLGHSQVSLEDWVRRELDVNPDQDCLPYSLRQDYFSWAVYGHFLASTDGHTDVATVCSVLLDALVNKHKQAVCMLDKPQCGRCTGGDNSSRDSSPEILSLLQMLVQHLPPCSQPWLVSHLDSVTGSGEDAGKVSCQTAVISFTRLVGQLPAYLWVVNTLTDTPTSQHVAAFVNTLEQSLALYVSESSYLPCPLTLHITQCVLTLKSCGAEDGLLHNLILHPLLAISILVHWTTIKSVLHASGVKGDNFLFATYFNTMAWAEKCIEAQTFCPCVPPPWLCGAALFSLGLRHHGNMHAVTGLLSQSCVDQEVLAAYCELSLLSLAAAYTHTELEKQYLTDVRMSLTSIIATHHHVLVALADKDLLETRVASHSARTFRKTALVQCVAEMKLSDACHTFGASPSTLTSVMHTYSQVCRQFEDTVRNQSISLLQLSKCAQFLKNVLNSVSLESLQSVDQNELSSAGPDFQHLVLSRLAAGR